MNIKKFLEIESKIAAGEKITIKLNEGSKEIVDHYLRAWRGRQDLANVISSVDATQNFSTFLNEIRSLIRTDQLDHAEALIDSMSSNDELEFIELRLEKSRCFLFRKNYNAVINLTTELLQKSLTPETTRMTLLQVRGIAKTYSGQMISAIEDLNLALAIGSSLPTAPSSFAALTVKSQAYSCLNDQENSAKHLRLAKSILDNTIDPDMWLERLLSYLRAQVRFDFYFSDRDQFIKTTSTALCIADWLGAKVVVRLCKDDLDGTSPTPSSLPFLGGQFIPEFKILLTDVPKAVTCLEDSPQASQIIELLCQKDYSKGELFEAVWGYRYNEAIHNVHLRNTLSRIRKYLPEGTLVSDNTVVRLKK